MLSIVIPSYKDPLLNTTIDSILKQSRGEIEVIPVLDGYTQSVVEDARIHPIYLHKNGGMKNAINTGMRMARGEYVMRLDEHCTFGESFDTILTEMDDNWVVIPRRYFLDVEKWEVMDIPPVDYEKLIVDTEHGKFAGVRWTTRTEERKHIPVDETMMMQGSCVVMKKTWWDTVVKELTVDGYGAHYHDQIEIAFKTWRAGGKLMVNKKTWYAHKHRSFPRTHHLPHSAAQPGWEYALNVWGEYYESVIKPRFEIH